MNGGNTSAVAWYDGETEAPAQYFSVITSYDYDAPIGESGAYGQPGIGGPNKFEVGLAGCCHVPQSLHVPCRLVPCCKGFRTLPYTLPELHGGCMHPLQPGKGPRSPLKPGHL